MKLICCDTAELPCIKGESGNYSGEDVGGAIQRIPALYQPPEAPLELPACRYASGKALQVMAAGRTLLDGGFIIKYIGHMKCIGCDTTELPSTKVKIELQS